MTWAKLDDTFHHHPKLMRVNLAAAGLFAYGLSYAADNLTDGHLPERWVRGQMAGDDETAAQQLVDAGLWDVASGGYQIHDFTDYNLSRSQRQAKAQAGRVGGSSKSEAKPEAKSKQEKGGNRGVPGSGSGSGSGKETTERNSGKSPSVSVAREDFEGWLQHYRDVTGRGDVRGSKPAREQFFARLNDGFSLDELKLATVGCHGDEFCRTHKHDVPETILRASKVQRYIQLGKEPATDKRSQRQRDRQALKERLQAEEAAA